MRTNFYEKAIRRDDTEKRSVCWRCRGGFSVLCPYLADLYKDAAIRAAQDLPKQARDNQLNHRDQT